MCWEYAAISCNNSDHMRPSRSATAEAYTRRATRRGVFRRKLFNCSVLPWKLV
ncbi:hypothetical protein HanRHA438_Chr04g0183181 [Helianthus annuus]|nr:hypothetical protein HanRHA438_Chr04g0183181 [Helianthus annuus]